MCKNARPCAIHVRACGRCVPNLAACKGKLDGGTPFRANFQLEHARELLGAARDRNRAPVHCRLPAIVHRQQALTFDQAEHSCEFRQPLRLAVSTADTMRRVPFIPQVGEVQWEPVVQQQPVQQPVQWEPVVQQQPVQPVVARQPVQVQRAPPPPPPKTSTGYKAAYGGRYDLRPRDQDRVHTPQFQSTLPTRTPRSNKESQRYSVSPLLFSCLPRTVLLMHLSISNPRTTCC